MPVKTFFAPTVARNFSSRSGLAIVEMLNVLNVLTRVSVLSSCLMVTWFWPSERSVTSVRPIICAVCQKIHLGYDGFGSFGIAVDLHPVPIIDAEHFLVACIASFWIALKIGGIGRKLSLMWCTPVPKRMHFVWPPPEQEPYRDAVAIFSKQLLDDGSVGMGRTK